VARRGRCNGLKDRSCERPETAGHGVNIVAAELSSEVYRQVFVKKDAH